MAAAARVRRVVVTALAIAALAGCAPRPADSVALAFYYRDQSGEAHLARIDDGRAERPIQVETGADPRSIGCGFMAPAWTLVVQPGGLGVEPDEAPILVRASGAMFGHPDELALWLDIDEAGVPTVGDGVPPWWDSDEQRCPGI